MPSMYSEPWAKLTMRVTPKMSDRPTATRNSDEAPASPLRNWMAMLDKMPWSRMTQVFTVQAKNLGFHRSHDFEQLQLQRLEIMTIMVDNVNRANGANGANGRRLFTPERGEDPATRLVLLPRPHLSDFGVARQELRAVGVVEASHHALAVLQRRPADIGAHGGLMIERAVGDLCRTACRPAGLSSRPTSFS